jgi:hypothetical protein
MLCFKQCVFRPLPGSSMTGMSLWQWRRHTTIGELGKWRCLRCPTQWCNSRTHHTAEEVFSVGLPWGFVRRASYGLKQSSWESQSGRHCELKWAAVGEPSPGANSWRKVPAEASSQRLVWEGCQPARMRAWKQKNIQHWDLLLGNTSEDCEK